MKKNNRILVLFKADVTVWLNAGMYEVEKAGRKIAAVIIYSKALDILHDNTN